jgi:hypothetical protein
VATNPQGNLPPTPNKPNAKTRSLGATT